MFSQEQKRYIAAKIERLLLEIGHPEMPTERPRFKLHVDGKEGWSWADIEPNWRFDDRDPGVNPHNERQASEWAPPPSAPPPEVFIGSDAHLLDCTKALLDLDAKGALVPHGIGGHARTLLTALATRLAECKRRDAGGSIVDRILG